MVESPTSTAAAPVFPLKLSASGRYLVDQRDNPWRIQADAAWLMSAVATPAQVDTYLATRKAQGFNSFYLMPMVHPGGYGVGPNNYAGAAPFTGALWTAAKVFTASSLALNLLPLKWKHTRRVAGAPAGR